VAAARSLRFATCGAHEPESGWLDGALRAVGHAVEPFALATAPADAILVHDPGACDAAQLERLRGSGARLMMRAYDDPDRLDEHLSIAPLCDVTLTNGFADCIEAYRRAGAHALTLLPAAPPSLTDDALANAHERPIDLLFAGRLDGPERRHRRELIDRAARRWRVQVVDTQFGGSRASLDAVFRRAKLALHWDRIAVNRHAITRDAPGTRPFAGPAAGCVLLAQLAPWMPLCYDVAEEMAGFADVEHGLAIAAEYLLDGRRRTRTASAGQRRCAAAHTYSHRAADVVALARGQTPLRLAVQSLAPWYQRIELPGGVTTSLLTMSNERRWARLAPHFPDVRGARVVDFGSNAGFFALQSLERGAAHAVAIDRSPLACRQARFVYTTLGASNVRVVEGDVEALAHEPADVVLMLAVLHHHAGIEGLLEAAVKQSPRALVLEWHVRDHPHRHSVDRVLGVLRALAYAAVVCDGGERPIVVARPARKQFDNRL
jgi:hypothetical protein